MGIIIDMADATTFYPGGANNPVPLAKAATLAVESTTVDDKGETTPIYFWTGTTADYEAIDTVNNVPAPDTTDPLYDANFSRTIYNTIG